MKKILILITISVVLAQNLFAQNEKVKVGPAQESAVEKKAWFSDRYESYKMDTSYISLIKSKSSDMKILVFAGEWCPDTKRLLPEFYKVTDHSGIDRNAIDLFLLDYDKSSPGKEEKKYKIRSVPTFIVLMDGKEAGRIVERVNGSIEQALFELMNKK